MAQMLEQLQQPEPAGKPQSFCILDGSSVLLAHEPELVEAFAPGRNQHGMSHWPVVKLVVAHQLTSGLASSPVWSPMYEPEAVSEQALAVSVMRGLAAGCVATSPGTLHSEKFSPSRAGKSDDALRMTLLGA